MSDDAVNAQATAALKGMLGIAGESSSIPTTQPTTAVSPPANEKPKKSNKKKKNKKKKNTPNPKQQAPPKENFAWSAFQSSPDASSLPIPTFESPAVPPKEVVDTSTQELKSMLGVVTEEKSSGPTEANQPSTGGVDLAQLAAARPPF